MLRLIEANNLGLFFPGQGSQHKGMGKDFYDLDNRGVAREVFDRADNLAQKLNLGCRITDLCFEDPDQELEGSNANTEKIQPALLTVSIAIFEHLRSIGLKLPKHMAGHSVGKFSAAVACGSLDFEDAFELVVKRGREMQDSKKTADTVVGVIDNSRREREAEETKGLKERVQEILNGLGEQASSFRVTIENSANQVMFGGLRTQLDPVIYELSKIHPRILQIYESAPLSHHPLLFSAQERFNLILESIRSRLGRLQVPIIDDLDGSVIETTDALVASCAQHMKDPISWREVMGVVVKEGITHALEVGPGKVLRGISSRGTGLEIFTTGSTRDIQLVQQKIPFAFS